MINHLMLRNLCLVVTCFGIFVLYLAYARSNYVFYPPIATITFLVAFVIAASSANHAVWKFRSIFETAIALEIGTKALRRPPPLAAIHR